MYDFIMTENNVIFHLFLFKLNNILSFTMFQN